MSLDVTPFTLQLPSGYSLAAGSTATPAKTASSTASSMAATATDAGSAPVDVVSISNAFDAGTFTAKTGDVFSLSALFNGQAGQSSAVVGYRVGLGDGDGTLLLNGKPLAGQAQLSGSFTADEFAHLTYTAGAAGTRQGLVIVAQTGTRHSDGTLTHEIDSPAVQITANVVGVAGGRSINAMNALRTPPDASDADADTIGIVQQAGIFTGFVGTTRSALQTDGNFTAKAGDIYRMSDLFKASAPTGQTIAGFRVALGGVASGDGGGKLQLNGADIVPARTTFSADEFARLTYVAGTCGPQNLVVIAQTGTRLAVPTGSPAGTLGALSHEIDSPAVQITANVTTGSRSINAMNALSNLKADDADAATVSIAQQAGIFTGFVGTTRPTLQTDGNFTAKAGDTYRVSDLFKASAPTGQTIAGFRVALSGVTSGGGKLQLHGVDVKDGTTSFSAEDFAHLTYITGTSGPQSLVVIAQTGTRLAAPTGSPPGTLGALTHEIDSPAVQITADVTGNRSINAMNALSTAPSGADANIVGIAQQAGIFTGFVGSTRPTLQTDGNFTAVAGDVYRISDLFKASAPTGQTIAGFRVALGDGGGKLQLNGVDVADGTTSFSAEDFAHLAYVTGLGVPQSLVVVAQTGTRAANAADGALGALSHEIDSPAVQITANVTTGSRSINAMNALSNLKADDADSETTGIVQQAGIFTGFVGSTRPTLQTDGNFTTVTGDIYRMSDLFKASAQTGQSLAGFRVALGGVAASDGGGKLQLNGVDVTDGTTSFTADQFAHLTFVAGAEDTQQSLVVVAQTGTRAANAADGTLGALSHEIDSAAVQITANVTGSRSINAMNALSTAPSAADAAIVGIVQQAGIFTGLVGSTRPTLQTVLTPEPPISLAALEDATGSYRSAGLAPANSEIDLLALYPGATGNSVSPGTFATPGGPLAIALQLLGGGATGAFQTAGSFTAQSQAIKAYNTAKGL